MSLVHDEATSADGTRIAYTSRGRGPAVLIVHGSLNTGAMWTPVAERLAPRFRVVTMDRRAHGRSGTGPAHSLEREAEDVVAVLGAIGEPVGLVGHSYGAVVALHAALTAPEGAVRRLALYEPPFPIDGPVGGAALESYRKLVASGRVGDAVALGLVEFAGTEPAMVAAMRRSPEWAPIEALGQTWIPEVAALDALPPHLDAYRTLAMPVLLLVGSESPKRPLKRSARALAQVLRNVRTVELEEQGHAAHRMGPDLLAHALADFFEPAPG